VGLQYESKLRGFPFGDISPLPKTISQSKGWYMSDFEDDSVHSLLSSPSTRQNSGKLIT
jgi:hypothetical protein